MCLAYRSTSRSATSGPYGKNIHAYRLVAPSFRASMLRYEDTTGKVCRYPNQSASVSLSIHLSLFFSLPRGKNDARRTLLHCPTINMALQPRVDPRWELGETNILGEAWDLRSQTLLLL